LTERVNRDSLFFLRKEDPASEREYVCDGEERTGSIGVLNTQDTMIPERPAQRVHVIQRYGAMPRGESPERKARLQEKEELSALNQRLERYILRLREEQTVVGHAQAPEGVMTLQQHQDEVRRIRDGFDASIAALTASRETAINDSREFQRQLEKELAAHRQAQEALAQASSRNEELRNRLAALEGDCEELKAEMIQISNQNDGLARDLARTQDELEQANHELREAQKAGKAAEAAKNSLEARMKVLEEDSAATKAQSEKSIASLLEQLEKARENDQAPEEDIRKELVRQMNEEIERQRRKLMAEHEALLNRQQVLFEGHVRGFSFKSDVSS